MLGTGAIGLTAGRITGVTVSSVLAMGVGGVLLLVTIQAALAQIALAWLHQQAVVHDVAVVPIPGTRHAARLQENLAAVGVTLTADELFRLEPIANGGPAQD